MGTFSKVFAIGFALTAALGGSVLIHAAFSDLSQRKPMEDGRPKETPRIIDPSRARRGRPVKCSITACNDGMPFPCELGLPSRRQAVPIQVERESDHRELFSERMPKVG